MQGKLDLDDTKEKDKYYIALNNLFINQPFFKTKIFEFFFFYIKRVFSTNFDDIK